jgi:hypothetical protein
MLRLRGVLDVDRFRGMLPVVVLLAVFFLGANFLLLGVTGFAPSRPVDREGMSPWEEVEDAESRAAGLSAFYERNPSEREKPFVLYLGMSTARQGVDAGVLRKDSCAWRFMGLFATGADFEHLFEVAMPILRRDFRPKVVLLLLHEYFLAGSEPIEVPSGSVNPIESLRQRKWRQAIRRLRWWDWFAHNYTYLNHLSFAGLVEAREAIRIIEPLDPWTSQPPRDLPYYRGDAYVQTQIADFATNGRFDPHNYQSGNDRGAKWLIRIMSEFRNRGAKVVVVKMPETVTMRAHIPAAAQPLLAQLIQRQFPTNTPPILDFRASIPDPLFTDGVHLNGDGRRVFSNKLVPALQPIFATEGCMGPRS